MLDVGLGLMECDRDVQIAAAPQLRIEMPNSIAETVATLGRTEDIRFSPDGSRIAVAGYRKSSCLLLDIAVERMDAAPVIRLSAALEITSPALNEPHGFEFVGDDLLVVANRSGTLVIFRLPRGATGTIEMMPERILRRAGLFNWIRTPGSVAMRPAGRETVELLVCNNYRDRVSAHRFRPDRPGGWVRSRIALARDMQIPDGIAISPDGAVVAVSSHATHEVLLYDAARRLDPGSAPVARLTGIEYPHGLRFADGGRRLFCADAGTRFVFVHDRPASGWRGTLAPVARFAPISAEVFRAGRSNPQEGGPKGIDIHPQAPVLAVTNEEQPLAFFDLEMPDLWHQPARSGGMT